MAALVLPATKAQTKKFDQPVQLKSCHISIEANAFTATTFMELEFFNPGNEVVEGRQNFHLNKGQVISAFQLDLNGKYRDGSIEEKWKALRSYSSIVGKRMDPAVIQMNYDNYYSLLIYPIPAKGSRKVTMTIDQLLMADSNRLTYELPLGFSGTTEDFSVDVNVSIPEKAFIYANKGFLEKTVFEKTKTGNTATLRRSNITVNLPLAFSVKMNEGIPQVCSISNNGKTDFFLRIDPSTQKFNDFHPKKLHIYWDASSSATQRDFSKELNFLDKYIADNGIKLASITIFNDKVRDSFLFETNPANLRQLRYYLLGYNYSGATDLGILDFSKDNTDLILLFSDGINTLGRPPKLQSVIPVTAVVSGIQSWRTQLSSFPGISGGSLVNLYSNAVSYAVAQTQQVKNFLFGYSSLNKTVVLNDHFPKELSENFILSGSYTNEDDLQLLYGNSSSINAVQHIALSAQNNCNEKIFNKVRMLKSYDSIIKSSWENLVYFGLREKVVTPQTSFIVLENIDDYIKYNIAPPKELEAACAERNYAYKTEYRIRQLKTLSAKDVLNLVIDDYNKYIKWWDSNETPIDLDQSLISSEQVIEKKEIKSSTPDLPTATTTSSTLNEVIVTSAFSTKRTLRSQSSNVQYIQADQLSTVRETNINNALAGKVAGIQVQSQSGGLLGATTKVRLRGENGLATGSGPIYVLDGMILADADAINVDNINDITVLQGPSASALFGPDGANGAIVINSKIKSPRYYNYSSKWPEYKLKDMDDVDYVKEIRAAETNQVVETYDRLEELHSGEPCFYFDMADFFFERKLKEKAMEILLEGIEACSGSSKGLTAAAFLLESHGEFEAAIKIYRNMLEASPGDPVCSRNLALAYFQNNNIQESVNTYYQLITSSEKNQNSYYSSIYRMAINEMNAIICQYRNKLNLSAVNPNLIRAFPVDLKISVESSYGYTDKCTIKAPESSIPSSIENNWNDYFHTERYKSFNNTNYSNRYNARFYAGDYIAKKASKGLYKINIDAYHYYTYKEEIPEFVRVITFRNFQQENQTLQVEYSMLNNQYGSVEIAEIKW